MYWRIERSRRSMKARFDLAASFVVLVFLLATCSGPTPAFAQTPVLLSGWRSAVPADITPNRVAFAVSWTTDTYDSVYDGSAVIANPASERARVRTWFFVTDLRVVSDFGVQITANWFEGEWQARGAAAGASDRRAALAGWGDTSVLAWYRLVASAPWHVNVLVGGTVPTGTLPSSRPGERFDEGSLLISSRLEQGAGAFIPVVGATANRASGSGSRGPRWSLQAIGKLPVAADGQGYVTGAAWEAIGGVSGLGPWTAVAVDTRLHFVRYERDRPPNVLPEGGVPGDMRVVAAAGATWKVARLSARAEVVWPVYRIYRIPQLDSGPRVRLTMGGHF